MSTYFKASCRALAYKNVPTIFSVHTQLANSSFTASMHCQETQAEVAMAFHTILLSRAISPTTRNGRRWGLGGNVIAAQGQSMDGPWLVCMSADPAQRLKSSTQKLDFLQALVSPAPPLHRDYALGPIVTQTVPRKRIGDIFVKRQVWHLESSTLSELLPSLCFYSYTRASFKNPPGGHSAAACPRSRSLLERPGADSRH